MVLWNLDILPHHYMLSQHRWTQFESSSPW